jgi:hypothetical protein
LNLKFCNSTTNVKKNISGDHPCLKVTPMARSSWLHGAIRKAVVEVVEAIVVVGDFNQISDVPGPDSVASLCFFTWWNSENRVFIL